MIKGIHESSSHHWKMKKWEEDFVWHIGGSMKTIDKGNLSSALDIAAPGGLKEEKTR